MLRFVALLAALMLAALPLSAQERFWVQIEAHPTLAEGEAAARAYAADIPDVAGIRLDTGWYAIVAGPYSEQQARQRRRALRRAGAIPRDAFITPGERFVEGFWPGEGEAAAPAPSEAEIAQALEEFESASDTSDAGVPPASAEPEPPRPETPAEARRSESALDAARRAEIQRALAWEGHYEGRIDSDFGPATRRAMAAWQRAIGANATGVLTTRQRARLLEGYRATLARLDLREIVEPEAGIRIEMPMGLVAFERYDYPFARYQSRDDSGVRALLISREGGRRALWGLYEVMQTLEIVPMEGARERGPRAFTLTGQNERLHSYSFATLADGAVKGFTLIWPPEEAEVMNRVARRMRESFASTGRAALAPAQAGGLPADAATLVDGLEVRRPAFAQSGFYTDAGGTVVTAARVADGCRRVTIGDGIGARVLDGDSAPGLAVLAPEIELAPAGWARFAAAPPAAGSAIAVAGFSYGGQLDAPVLTFGSFAAATGLDGETTRHRLSLAARPADAGGPVLRADGAVAGMLLAVAGGARQLPEDVRFAVPAARIVVALEAAGRPAARAEPGRSALPAEALTRQARRMTALVSCWQ